MRKQQFDCRWPGCSGRFYCQKFLDDHEKKPHQQCPRCKKFFIELKKHIAQHKRKGTTCVKVFEIAKGIDVSEERVKVPDCRE